MPIPEESLIERAMLGESDGKVPLAGAETLPEEIFKWLEPGKILGKVDGELKDKFTHIVDWQENIITQNEMEPVDMTAKRARAEAEAIVDVDKGKVAELSNGICFHSVLTPESNAVFS